LFSNAGTVQKSSGTGTTYIAVPFYNSGSLGLYIGTVNFNSANSYTQTGATLNFGLAGPSRPALMVVSGNLRLDGTLGASLQNNYVPKLGDSISLASCGTLTSSFNYASLPPAGSNLGWRVAYGANGVSLQVVSNANASAQIAGSVTDTNGLPVTNITVAAFTTNSNNSIFLSTVTDSKGNYVLNVTNGVWRVGIQGSIARGYNDVPTQDVVVNNANQTANFVVQPYSGPGYTITVAANPPTGGTASGGGVFLPGSLVTLSATASTNILPYFFTGWTENGILLSTANPYAFLAQRNQQLAANFTLPQFTISASNNPPLAGTVSGTGSYFYGSTNVLSAQPNFGYNFGWWSEGASVLGTSPSLTNIVYTNHTFVANYTEANTNHFVTTGTQPPGLAGVTGAGVYTNGQAATFSAPAVIVSGQYDYFFQEFVLTNAAVSTSNSFTKTFSTLDPTNLQYTAVYSGIGIAPLVTNVSVNFPIPVPATTNFQISFRFDRTMNINFTPQVKLTNSAPAAAQATVPAGGRWGSVIQNNDTFYLPPVTFTQGMDGTIQVFISGAQDPLGVSIGQTNVYAILLDATPPMLSDIAANPSVLSAFVTWNSDEPASSLVEYGASTAYGLNSGWNSQLVTAHGVTLYNLSPQTTYHYRAHSRDQAGNEGISGDGNFTTFAAPDLQVANLSVTGNLVSGGAVLISWADTNSGSGATFNYWYDQVIVTNSTARQTVWNSSVFYDPGANGTIAAGGSRSRQLSFQLPKGPPGAGNLEAIITVNAYGNQYEANGTGDAQSNNTAALSFSSTLAAYPDLQITGLIVTNSQLQSGGVVGLVWNDTNTGNGSVSNSFYNEIMVVNQTTAQTLVNAVVTDDAAAAPIGPGQSARRQFSFVLPDGEAGSGPLQVTVTADIYNNVFEYNASGTAKNNNSATTTATSILAPYPDLTVTNISGPASASAGQTVRITWADANIGNAPVTNTWYDQVFLSPTNVIRNGQLMGTFLLTNVVQAGSLVTITQNVMLPAIVSGNQWLIVKANAAQSFFEPNTANNSGISSQPMNVTPTLQLALSAATVSESSGTNAVSATLTRNAGISSALIVQLSSVTGTNLHVPTNVRIPAGQSGVTFTLGPIDNFISGPPVNETVTASASGFPSVAAPLTILDNDAMVLSLSLGNTSANEDAGTNSVKGTVTRNSNFGQPLTVTLSSDFPSALTVPTTVIIPAGQASAGIGLTPVHDGIVTDTRRVHVLASAPGFNPVSATMDVLNVDTIQLNLVLETGTVNKGTGSLADVGTVSLPAGLATAQNVQLTVQNNALVSLPSIVTIPAGTTSVNFNIGVTNDYLVTGAQAATLLAQVLTPSGVALSNGQATATLSIQDINGPTLALRPAAGTISKGSNIVVTVSRNTPATNDLTVSLSSSPTNVVSMPPSLILPVSQVSTTFTASGVLDNQPTGSRQVTLTASAAGYNSGVAPLTVSDIYLPDLVPTIINGPTNAMTGAALSVNWVIANNGLGAATNRTWYDYVYLASSAAGQNPTLAAFATNPAALPIGASYTNQATLYLPPTPGSYWVSVVTDGGGAVNELNKQNNTLVSLQPVVVNPAYRAAITNVAPSVAKAGTPIVLSGWAFNPAASQPVPNSLVAISIQVHGTVRNYTAFSDATGAFRYTFQPLATEAGDYAAGAEYPYFSQISPQASFALLGMQAQPAGLTIQLLPNTPTSGQFIVNNLSGHTLTGLAFTLPDFQGSFSATFSLTNTTLLGNASLTVNYTMQSPITRSAQLKFSALASSAEGAQLAIPVVVNVRPLVAQLIANPGYLTRGMLVGHQTILSFDILNTGGASSGDLNVQLPADTSWMALASPAVISSIPAGGKATVTLNLNPARDLPLNLYSGSLAVFNASNGLTEPFQLRAVSTNTGTLLITVTDDYTYYVSGAPHVTNAMVTVRDPFTSQLVAQTNSDQNGNAYFSDLPEGPYTIEASAPKHNPFRGSVSVVSGTTNELEAFMARQLVTYQWTVVPTEIQDQYQIQLESVFETEVPVPNVVVENPEEIILVTPGEPSQYDLELRNVGLIAANNVLISVPYDATYLMTPLVTNVGVIPAQSSVSIPIMIQLRSDLGTTNVPQPKGPVNISPCGISISPNPCDIFPKIPVDISYTYDCGTHTLVQHRSAQMDLLCTAKQLKDRLKSCLKAFNAARGTDFRSISSIAALGCSTLSAFLNCLLGGDTGLDPCVMAAFNALCGARTGVLGAVGGFLNGGGIKCICNHLPDIPLPSAPPSSGGGGDLGLGFNPTAASYYAAIIESLTGIDVPGACNNPITSLLSKPHVVRQVLASTAPLAIKAPIKAETSRGVCAQVRLRINQNVMLTRSAFTGTLELDNGGDHAIDSIRVTLDFRDATNGPAAEKFAVEGPTVSGLGAVDGTGTLAGGGSGSAVYTFIPTLDAAPNAPATYQIGGTLTYNDNGAPVIVPLLSSPITVYPEARLDLTYFQQRDVYGDDPFTPQIEPSEPFTLGLIVKNVGAGSAHNFRITSGQPQIVDNQKGLLINFTIIGTEVGDQAISPSLSANLGDIPPGNAKEVTWEMISSLQGKFISFNATFQHVNDFGSTNTSLINTITIHELTHQVLANRPTDDDVPDFLVNDIPDPDNLPDTLYLSDGTVAPVSVITNGSFDAPAGLGHLQVKLTTAVSNGWNYIRLPDPGAGYILQSVVRSDGKVLALTNNAWTTDRSFPSASTGAVYQNLLHLFDWAGTGSYTLYYHSTNTTPPAIVALGPVNPFVQSGAVSTVNIAFSEPVNTSTFSPANLRLSLDGGANLIPSGAAVNLTLVSNTTYSINGLAPFSAADGNYQLTVIGSGIYDLWGNNAGNASASTQWAKGNAAPVVQSISPISPNPRNAPITSVTVNFSKAINPATFNYQALSLTLNGGPSLITSGVSVTAQSASSFNISGLGPLTGAEGSYMLTVNATSVQDTNGTAGFGLQSVSWTMITTGPRITALEPINTNPRNIVVPSLNITFSEPIDPATFDYHAITLTRNGGPNLATSDVSVTQLSPTTFHVGNISWVQGYAGTYLFMVSAAGVADLAGNAGTGSTNESWQIILGAPAAPTDLFITPDLGISSTDGLTSTNAITLFGTIATNNLTVRVFDATVGSDLGTATVTGTNFSAPLSFTIEGMHHLQITAVDAAGNVSTPSFFELFLDIVPPAAIIQQVPSPSYAAVSSIPVTFSKPINTNTISATNFVITLNGTNLFTPSLTPVTANTFLLGNLASFTAAPGAYQVTLYLAGIQDYAGNTSTDSVAMAWANANLPPVIAPLTNMVASPGAPLSFQVSASDPRGYPLRYTLATSAPIGASINAINGAFTWTPTCAQGGITNLITIWVADQGSPVLSNSASVLVSVRDCLQVSIGPSAVQVGQSACLPLNLLSTAGVTNLSFTLDYPGNRFTNWAITVTNPGLATASAQVLDSFHTLFTLVTKPGQVLRGPAVPAWICLSALPGPSGVVPLRVENVAGVESNGSDVATTFGQAGRVTVISLQPVLEASLGTNLTRLLTLYGNPGASYEVDYATNLPGTNWHFGWRVPMTSLSEVFTPNTSLPRVFYRAFQFSADPPILELQSSAGMNLLLLYGKAGTNYVVEKTINLSPTNVWFPYANFALSNSFQFINPGGLTNQGTFFRAKRP
jgi:hypothetical protein